MNPPTTHVCTAVEWPHALLTVRTPFPLHTPIGTVLYHPIPSSHQVWGAEPSSVWFVGDSIDDMVCGKLAGCRTCLIITEDNTAVVAQTQFVDLAVHSLRDFGLHIGLDL